MRTWTRSSPDSAHVARTACMGKADPGIDFITKHNTDTETIHCCQPTNLGSRHLLSSLRQQPPSTAVVLTAPLGTSYLPWSALLISHKAQPSQPTSLQRLVVFSTTATVRWHQPS
ncbi:hypothetical protein WN944_022193 [Citrus x changshan-huyou]|uniref:Uncharacterized protein n=1 Tax=Citrus x changshan-huyou TaxID=2935761 RepID=A0AAP0N481_9ROSI